MAAHSDELGTWARLPLHSGQLRLSDTDEALHSVAEFAALYLVEVKLVQPCPGNPQEALKTLE